MKTDPIDHTIPSRNHAQYISRLITDESRLSSHKIKTEELNSLLIRRYAISKIEYSSKLGYSTMPLGLEEHEVYLIRWKDNY